MMTQEQAAKYFIVAWVKDWSIRNYLMIVTHNNDMVGPSAYPFEKAHETFPWLPANVIMFAMNVRIRRYIGDSFHKLNNALWDAADNEQRLKLYKLVMQTNGQHAGCVRDKHKNDEAYAIRKSKALAQSHRMSKLCKEKFLRSAWGVVKGRPK